MITKEEFVKLVTDHQKWDDRMEEVCSIMNCGLIDADWIEYTSMLFDNNLKLLFLPEAVDTILWWMYEITDRSVPNMWDKDHNVIPMETIDDLWDYVKDLQREN